VIKVRTVRKSNIPYQRYTWPLTFADLVQTLQ